MSFTLPSNSLIVLYNPPLKPTLFERTPAYQALTKKKVDLRTQRKEYHEEKKTIGEKSSSILFLGQWSIG